jgi:hypothetical protein
MNRKISRILRPIALFCGSVAAVATTVVVLGTTTPSAPAYFHMAHLSPNTPAVDLYVDGVLQDTGMTFGQVGPMRTMGRSGPMSVGVVLAGTSPASGLVLSARVNLAPGTTYVVAVANWLNRLQVGTYRFNNADNPAFKGRVQVLNTIPEGPRLKVEASTGAILADWLGYLEEPSYFDLFPGKYILTGSLADNPARAIFQETYDLQSGEVYMLIVAGPPIRAIMVQLQSDASQQAVLPGGGGASAGGCSVYVVQPGDTLGGIARRFGTTVDAIVADNNLANPNMLSVGQELLICE